MESTLSTPLAARSLSKMSLRRSRPFSQVTPTTSVAWLAHPVVFTWPQVRSHTWASRPMSSFGVSTTENSTVASLCTRSKFKPWHFLPMTSILLLLGAEMTTGMVIMISYTVLHASILATHVSEVFEHKSPILSFSWLLQNVIKWHNIIWWETLVRFLIWQFGKFSIIVYINACAYGAKHRDHKF